MFLYLFIGKKTTEKLYSSLVCYVAEHNIPLSYHDNLDDAAGRIVYKRKLGNNRWVCENYHIEILHEYKQRYSLLAHELGHYIELEKGKESTEDGARTEARTLCESFLSWPEKLAMRWEFDIYFR